MRRFRRPERFVFSAVVVALLTACDLQSATDGRPTRDALEQRQAVFFDAMAMRDAPRVASLFAEDAVLHIAGMPPIRGRDPITTFYENVFRFLESSQATPEPIRIADGGDMAFTTGRAENVFAGGTSVFVGKFVLVWEHRGDDWYVAAYSLSSDEQEAQR